MSGIIFTQLIRDERMDVGIIQAIEYQRIRIRWIVAPNASMENPDQSQFWGMITSAIVTLFDKDRPRQDEPRIAGSMGALLCKNGETKIISVMAHP